MEFQTIARINNIFSRKCNGNIIFDEFIINFFRIIFQENLFITLLEIVTRSFMKNEFVKDYNN